MATAADCCTLDALIASIASSEGNSSTLSALRALKCAVCGTGGSGPTGCVQCPTGATGPAGATGAVGATGVSGTGVSCPDILYFGDTAALPVQPVAGVQTHVFLDPGNGVAGVPVVVGSQTNLGVALLAPGVKMCGQRCATRLCVTVALPVNLVLTGELFLLFNVTVNTAPAVGVAPLPANLAFELALGPIVSDQVIRVLSGCVDINSGIILPDGAIVGIRMSAFTGPGTLLGGIPISVTASLCTVCCDTPVPVPG